MEKSFIELLQALERLKKWIYKLEERIAILEQEVNNLNVR